jgi:hypothetical protein
MPKKRKRAPWVCLGLAALLAALPWIFRDTLLVSPKGGTVVADTLKWLALIPLAVTGLVLFISALRRPPRKPEEKPAKFTLTYKSKALNPEGIRKYLEQLKSQHPGLTGLLDECIKQIGGIKTRQAKLGELISLNEASYLEDAPAALGEAEQLILRNLLWVINRGIVSETDGNAATGDDREFTGLIRQVLAANDEVLAKCRTLVAGASDLISGKGGTGSTAAVEAWIVAIRQQVRTSALDKKEEG